MAQEASVLVLNTGSATVKYRLVTPEGSHGGTVEHVGEADGPADHAAAVAQALSTITAQPAAIGHRVVHGGSELTAATLIDASVEQAIDHWSAFAPLHNPAALAGIRAATAAYPSIPQVAVFDTAFHATMPPQAATYAIDRHVAAKLGLRRYGFHGISVRNVRDATARLLQRPYQELNLIVLHLGSGASATAIANGSSVDTSMGMTPMPGLVMGTRSGDIDPGLTFALSRAGWTLPEIEQLYDRYSGLRGLTGESDMRTVLSWAAGGDEAAELAVAVYCHRLRHYVGAYTAILGRVDAITFTGGVGENSAQIRRRALEGLAGLGIELDPNADPPLISTPDSRVRVCVIPTDEERQIAVETAQLLRLPGWH